MNQLERQAAALRAVGRIEGFKAELGRLTSALETVPLWLPAAGLVRQSVEGIRMIDAIAARFDRRLVVTLIGPSGSGKSTLVNALAGGLSCRRPGTGVRPRAGSCSSAAERRRLMNSRGSSAPRPSRSGPLQAGGCRRACA